MDFDEVAACMVFWCLWIPCSVSCIQRAFGKSHSGAQRFLHTKGVWEVSFGGAAFLAYKGCLGSLVRRQMMYSSVTSTHIWH